MTALYIVGALALIIFILLMLWVKVTVKFKEEFVYTVKVGPFYIDLDSPDKDDDDGAPRDKSKKDKEEKKKGGKEKKKSASTEHFSTKELYNAVFDLLGILKEFLFKYSDTLHLYSSRFYVKIATGDAASTALECAAIKGAVSVLFDFIDQYAVIDKGSEKNVIIIPDFTSDVSECDIELIFRTRLGNLIKTLFTLFYRYIKKTVEREISQNKKGKQL